jgi:hypothetical protein
LDPALNHIGFVDALSRTSPFFASRVSRADGEGARAEGTEPHPRRGVAARMGEAASRMSDTDEPGEIDTPEPDVEFVGAASPITIEFIEVKS